MGMSSTSSCQLERMAGELKCPICLSLYKQAATLSCNHCFCTACIVQSMKRIPCCPICKVPATPREVRCAPQMDSLVSIFRGMESSAGVSLFQTQPSQAKSSAAEKESYNSTKVQVVNGKPRAGKRNARPSKNAMDSKNVITNPPKKCRKAKSDQVLSDVVNRQADYGMLGNVMKRDEQTTAGVVHQPMHGVCTSDQDETKINSHIPDCQAIDPPLQDAACTRSRIIQNHTRIENESRMDSMRREVPSSHWVQEDEGSARVYTGPHNQHLTCPSPDKLPNIGRPQLSPFFWLRDGVTPSQDEAPTQLTQTQLTARPLRPSFSDLKGSDDDDPLEDMQYPDEADGKRLTEADSYDSDTFIWTQRPCSPELSTSPLKIVKPLKSHIICDEHGELGRSEKVLHGIGDEDTRSPPKIVDPPVAVEATQTPQLLQEPARMMKGTLMKCSRLKKCDRGKSQSKACRSLRSHDTPDNGRNTPLSKSVNLKVVGSRAHKLLSADSCLETHTKANLTSKSDVQMDIPIEENCEDLPQREPCDEYNSVPNLPQVGISGRETRTDDGALQQEGALDYDLACEFCGAAGDSKVAGPMVQFKDTFLSQGFRRMRAVHVHKLCAEWAPDVYFDEEEPINLTSEVRRGQKIKCSRCGKQGAALGCCNKRCKMSFHYPCGRAISGCKWNKDDFVMFCPQHANCQFPRRKKFKGSSGKDHGFENTQRDRLGISDKNITHVPPLAAVPLQRWHTGPACKWVLCGSGLDSQMKGKLAGFASLTGAAIVKRWSPSVTHVITGVDEQGAARRTLKYLMAILDAKWIVKVEWMLECIKVGHAVAEEHHEVNADSNGFIDGPKRSRGLAALKAPKLLEGLSFYFCGDFTSLGKEDLQSLIVAGKGVVLHRKPLPCEVSLPKNRAQILPQNCQTFVLYNGEDGKHQASAQLVEEAKSIAVHACAQAVPHSWLLDSIAACMLLATS